MKLLGEFKMEQKKNNFPSGVVYIIAWLLCTILLIGDVLMVREATRDVLTVVQKQQTEKTQEGVQALTKIKWGGIIENVDRGILVAGAVAAVALSLLIEHHFRKGRENGTLTKRILKVVGIQLAVIAVSILVQTLV
jgi:hypothetical protein